MSTSESPNKDKSDGEVDRKSSTDDSSDDSTSSSGNDESSNTSSGTAGSGDKKASNNTEGVMSDGEDHNKTSDDSFETVNTTTAKTDMDHEDSLLGNELLALVSNNRSKSVSPGKVTMKVAQRQSSVSPVVKTPGKTPNKLTPSKKSTPAKKNNAVECTDEVLQVPDKKTKNPPIPNTTRKRTKSSDSSTNKQVNQVTKATDTKKADNDEVRVKVNPSTDKSDSRKLKKSKDTDKVASKEVVKKRKVKSPVKRKERSTESGKEDSDEPTTSTRIQKIPAGRRYQKIAISRAKECGLIVHGQIRILKITKALQIIDKVKFRVLPTHVFRHYYKCPGTGLPHIRRHLRNWQAKYGSLIKALAKLHLNLALASERKKALLVGPEVDNQYKEIWQFDNDVKYTEVTRKKVEVRKCSESKPDKALPTPPPTKKVKMEQKSPRSPKSPKPRKSSRVNESSEEGSPKTHKKRKKEKKSKKEAKAKKAK